MTTDADANMDSRPGLVLIHALGQDGAAWQFVGWPGALTPTLAGFGSGPIERRTLPEMADEVAALAPASFDVVGVAFGGIVAQHLLLRHPGRVRSALLACTTGTAGDRRGMLQRAAEARSRGLGALVPTLLERWFTPAALACDDPGVRYVRERLNVLSTEGYAYALEAGADHEAMSALEGIRLPVTLVVGLDDHVGRGTVEAMWERIPGARMRSVAGPHMLHLEQPQIVKEEIRLHLEWVAELEKAGGTAGTSSP